MQYVLGIDLGTTYSCVAYIDEFGKPVVLSNADGEDTTPSVVLFDSADSIIVGAEAKRSAKVEPDKVVQFIKRKMGKADDKVIVNGISYSAPEVSSYILKKLVADANSQLIQNGVIQPGQEIKDVVITCPAYFGMNEKQATKTAGELAGLNVLDIINEPINGYRIPQIVHLVVNCVPNSNFAALYVGIGNAIDRALGLDMVYEKMISRMGSLGAKAEKVRQLVEQFSIGIIIFDEIQLIDFSTARENSFESLMVLTNRTKVAIGVVGTTDAYSKMFTNVRTARRIGVLVSSCQYCDNKAFFAYLVQNLMRYQWFDSPVAVTEEIVDALYANTHGIIDQLVSIYICMHIEYLNRKTRPKVDAAFINRVAEKYYPQMRKLLETMENPENDRRIRELVQNAQKQLETRQDEIQQKVAGKSIMESQAAAIDMEALEKNVLINIRNVTDDYSTDTIHDAFIKVVSRKGMTDESSVTKAVFQQLQKGRGDKRPAGKRSNKIPHEVMQQEVLASVS